MMLQLNKDDNVHKRDKQLFEKWLEDVYLSVRLKFKISAITGPTRLCFLDNHSSLWWFQAIFTGLGHSPLEKIVPSPKKAFYEQRN